MENYKTHFKAIARAKAIEAQDMISYAVLKAMSAKSEDKIGILENIISKSFTPGKVCQHRQHPYQAVRLFSRVAHNKITNKWLAPHKLFGVPASEILNTEELMTQYCELLQGLYLYAGTNHE